MHLHQEVLCQGNFLGYLEVQTSGYIAGLQKTHFNWAQANQNFTIPALAMAADDTIKAAMTTGNNAPAGGDLSLSPKHRRLLECSVAKCKRVVVTVVIHAYISHTHMNNTCFWAAKITFMKFMYWRAQSSAALITCSGERRQYFFFLCSNQDYTALSQNIMISSPVFLTLSPAQLKQRGNKLRWKKINIIGNYFSKSNKENVWLTLHIFWDFINVF